MSETNVGARPVDAQLLDEAASALDRYEWQDIVADVQVRELVERIRARAAELRAPAAQSPRSQNENQGASLRDAELSLLAAWSELSCAIDLHGNERIRRAERAFWRVWQSARSDSDAPKTPESPRSAPLECRPDCESWQGEWVQDKSMCSCGASSPPDSAPTMKDLGMAAQARQLTEGLDHLREVVIAFTRPCVAVARECPCARHSILAAVEQLRASGEVSAPRVKEESVSEASADTASPTRNADRQKDESRDDMTGAKGWEFYDALESVANLVGFGGDPWEDPHTVATIVCGHMQTIQDLHEQLRAADASPGERAKELASQLTAALGEPSKEEIEAALRVWRDWHEGTPVKPERADLRFMRRVLSAFLQKRREASSNE